jgi:hypothetical protein
MGYQIIGNDCVTCGTAPTSCNGVNGTAKPSIGVYDNPAQPTTPTAVSSVTSALGKPDNYIGLHSSPDIENAYAALQSLTPEGLNGVVTGYESIATNLDPNFIDYGTATNPAINVIRGNATLGPRHGYGVLVVTGNLTISGDYAWDGLILVIGTGAFLMNGGENGQINGAVFVANTGGGSPPGTALGSPNANWSGGGGNGIQYNHCWADDMLAKVPFFPTASQNALRIISLRNLIY